jgi:copper chaperone
MKISIPDMSCAHCKAVIERTVRATDNAAVISVDLVARCAEIETTASIGELLASLKSEGYPATRLD